MNGLNREDLLQVVEGVALDYGMRVIGALVTLIIGWMIAKAVKRGMQRLVARTEFDETLEVFISNLVYWAVLVIVFTAVLGVFGIETTSILAVLGAGGLAVGLAMQGSLSNFAAGFMLMIFRPFKLGDFVEVGGCSGTVVEIGIFSTNLTTGDNIRIVIPNAAIYGSVISNYSFHSTRRIDLVVGISYTDDIGTAMEILRRVLSQHERILADPAPLVAVSELADSSVNFVLRPWCNAGDYWAIRFDLQRRIKEELEAGGCSLPYPQADLHLFQEGSGS